MRIRQIARGSGRAATLRVMCPRWAPRSTPRRADEAPRRVARHERGTGLGPKPRWIVDGMNVIGSRPDRRWNSAPTHVKRTRRITAAVVARWLADCVCERARCRKWRRRTQAANLVVECRWWRRMGTPALSPLSPPTRTSQSASPALGLGSDRLAPSGATWMTARDDCPRPRCAHAGNLAT